MTETNKDNIGIVNVVQSGDLTLRRDPVYVPEEIEVDDISAPSTEMEITPDDSPTVADEADIDINTMPYIDRELSWINFNARVLNLAQSPEIPLLERIKFLSIANSNMDEFFSVRVASRVQQLKDVEDIEGNRIVSDIIRKCSSMSTSFDSEYIKLLGELKANSITIHDRSNTDVFKTNKVKRHFKYNIKPSLTPLSLDTTRPLPHLKPFSIYIALIVTDNNGEEHIGLVEIPPHLKRVISIGKLGYFFVEDIIISHINQLYPGVSCSDITAFRLLRDGDTVKATDDMGYVESMMKHARSRVLYNDPIRLDIWSKPNKKIVNIIKNSLKIASKSIFYIGTRLKMQDIMDLYSASDDAELKYPPFKSANIIGNNNGSFMDMIHKRDILVHHPYESFNDTVLRLVKEACTDPDVISIKQTLYRSGEDSNIVKYLIHAAESGKSVVVVMELKARFDEEVNIEWADKLQRAGATVVYGYEHIKTHAKLLHIFRRKGKNGEQYCHIGTGNYSEKNSKVYTDFSYFTRNKKICSDINNIFNMLTGGFISEKVKFHNIAISPIRVRPRLYELIQEQIDKGSNGYIAIKVNNIADPGIVKELYRASNAGVSVDIICRGSCSVNPGIKGYSENISVKSIVGRFLEHDRVLIFGRREDCKVFITSSDLMTRNLDRRLEILFEIQLSVMKETLYNYMEIMQKDEANSHVIRHELHDTSSDEVVHWMDLDTFNNTKYVKDTGNFNSQSTLISNYSRKAQSIR